MRKRILQEIASKLGIRVPIWSSFDLIGDLVLLKAPFKPRGPSPEDLEEYKLLARELMKQLPYVKGVFIALTPVEGEYRLRKVMHLAGKTDSTTIYKEHGCLFHVDLKEAYVSPRLSYEHARIASLVKPGEFVVNMFSGMGGFSIVIAKKSRPYRVVSIDLNPRAVELMVKNIIVNRVDDVVVPVRGDAVNIIQSSLSGTADRVLMPLPSYSKTFYAAAVDALRRKGMLHAYEFQRVEKGENPPGSYAVRKAFSRVESIVKEVSPHVKLTLVGGRVVRSVGPRLYQVVLDIRVTK